MTEVRCSHCGRFILSTNAPWGRVTAYCKGCRQMRTILLGKPPDEQRTPDRSRMVVVVKR